MYNNRLYDRSVKSIFYVSRERYPKAFSIIDYYNSQLGFAPLKELVNFSEIFPVILNNNDNEEKMKALEDSKNMLYNASIAKRELSIEQYRKENDNDKPSRLHSLYACNEKELNYWINCISLSNPNKFEIYKIDTENEPFCTNEQLLPNEISTYEESYNSAKRYFHPRKSDLGEYLMNI